MSPTQPYRWKMPTDDGTVGVYLQATNQSVLGGKSAFGAHEAQRMLILSSHMST